MAHESALAEDATVFEYDEVYEDIVAERNAKQLEANKADKDKKVGIFGWGRAGHYGWALHPVS